MNESMASVVAAMASAVDAMATSVEVARAEEWYAPPLGLMGPLLVVVWMFGVWLLVTHRLDDTPSQK